MQEYIYIYIYIGCEVMAERGRLALEAASTEDGKHTETEAFRQCLLADGVARKSSQELECHISDVCMCVCMYLGCMYVCMYV